jgi:hypothetical protein
MTEYHKINAIFKRYMDGPQKGRLIEGDWASPEFGYLADNQWEFTEKVDGTNIRIEFHNNGLEFKGRTDNASIPTPLMAHLEKTFLLEDMLPHFDLGNSTEVTLYGEGYGPKIQNGGLYRQDVSFVLFDVKIGYFWLTRPNVNDIADKLGIDSVPVLGTGTIHDAIQMVRYGTVTKDGQIFPVNRNADFEGLCSQWGPFEAEGIVARPVVPLFNRKGERIIAKIKARDFR